MTLLSNNIMGEIIYLTKTPIEMFPKTEKNNTLAHGRFSTNIKYGIDTLSSVMGKIEYKKILIASIFISNIVLSKYISPY